MNDIIEDDGWDDYDCWQNIQRILTLVIQCICKNKNA